MTKLYGYSIIDDIDPITHLAIVVGGVENSFDKELFTIYPNPATDMLEINTDIPVLQVKILDINGRMVIESENNDRIDIKHLISGIYFLKINDKYFHKFIKE